MYLLLPLSWCYQLVLALRKLAYRAGVLPVTELPVPVIVVGNITVGGSGKTPLVIWLAEYLRGKGFHPGIVSRGYGGKAGSWPQQVRADSDPAIVGDEPVLLARRTGCPVAVAPRRFLAAYALHQHKQCDLVICDDGLQHFAMGRDIEIAVVDGDRRFGNGFLLPAGPLRESTARLQAVDLVVASGKAQKHEFLMEYRGRPLVSLSRPEMTRAIEELRGERVHAVAGIGNPQRFFSYLRSHGIQLIKHRFPDHFRFKAEHLRFGDGLPVVMTEKDAVKCRQFTLEHCWILPIEAHLSDAFEHRFSQLLKDTLDEQKTA